MAKLLLLSVVLVSMGIPISAAKDRLPRRGLKRAIWGVVMYNVFYLFAILFIYPRIA